MKRRQFIQSGSMMSVPLFLNGMEISAMAQSSLFQFASEKEDRVLVLVQLNGGNDGLNMVIPIDQYSGLDAVRKPLILPESSVLKFIDKTGIHPAMAGMHNKYKEGEIAVVQSVGYPNQNRSHFRSTDIWTSASKSNEYISTGWMGRYFDEKYAGFPEDYPNQDNPDPFAITLGSIVSETCQGEVANFSFTLRNEASVKLIEETIAAPDDGTCYAQKLSYIHTTIKQSNAYATTVLNAFDKGSNIATYPDNTFASQLKVVANLISGGLKTKIYVVNLGGFDTHANQVVIGSTLEGDHATLLKTISDGVSAFMNDCKSLGLSDRVMGMTFSEFGRQIRANNSYGTDHGTAAPLFVFGSCVNAGIFGHNPVIDANVQAQEGVPMQHDFRSVYATLLIDWLGANETQIKNILFEDFQRIPFVKDCSLPSNIDDINGELSYELFPNPCVDRIKLKLDHAGGLLHISVLDTLGSLITLQVSKSVSRGTHEFEIPMQNFPSGTYFVRCASSGKVKTSKFVKI